MNESDYPAQLATVTDSAWASEPTEAEEEEDFDDDFDDEWDEEFEEEDPADDDPESDDSAEQGRLDRNFR